MEKRMSCMKIERGDEKRGMRKRSSLERGSIDLMRDLLDNMQFILVIR